MNQAGLDALGEQPQLLKLIIEVTDFKAVDAAAARTENELGPIDRLVNAAAIMPLGLLTQQPVEVIHKIMIINYGGFINVTKAVLSRMLDRKRGEFVSFASMAGHWPILYMGAYDASKHAVVAFSEVLHHENRHSGVQFLCVCPTTVATPLLKQAKDTAWPKMLDVFPPITSEHVLDELERSLKRKHFWSFAGPFTRVAWRLRRWAPGLMWSQVHRVEGF